MYTKRFTAGLVTGAVIGGIVGMMVDPITDKEHRKIRRGAGSIIHAVANIVDGFVDDMKR